MHWRLAFISFTLIIGTLVTLVSAYLGWTRRRETGAYSFILFMAAICIWSLSYALEQFTPDLQEKIFWHKMAYLGIPYVPLSWFVFNAQILKFRFAHQKLWLAVLSIIPVAMTILTWTLEQHDYMWGTLSIASYGGVDYLALERTPDYVIFVGYSYVLLLLGTLLYVKVLLQSPSLRLSTIAFLSFAMAMPIIFNVLRIVFSLDPFWPYDLTLLALTTTGVTAGWFVFRFGPLDVLSVARIALLESINDGFIVFGLSGVIVGMNRAAQQLLGVTETQAIGQTFNDILPRTRQYLDAETSQSVEHDVAEIGLDFTRPVMTQQIHREVLMSDNGGIEEDVYIDLSVSYLYDQRERLRGTLLILRDITQRKRTQQALLQAQRMESTGLLAGGVAHDFNNLLAVITMRHQLAINAIAESDFVPLNQQVEDPVTKPLPEEPVSKTHSSLRHLEIAGKAVERATDLTRQLLAFTGKGHFKIEPLDINNLIEENRALLATAVPRQIEFHINLSSAPLYIDADRGQIQQVIMNLLLNAVEAIGKDGGGIEVQTGTCSIESGEAQAYIWKDDPLPGMYVYISVSDSGAGMLPEIQARIFDPFFTTKKDGRGLGLSALLGAIHLYNGGIQVISKQGRGTTFQALLPHTEKPLQMDELSEQQHRHNNSSVRGTILVVDDEEPLLEVLGEILTDLGLKVLTATNGKKAIDVFNLYQDQIDLVLLDAKMPVMGGIEALAILRETAPQLSALLSSGYSEQEVSLAVEWDAYTDFIQKPYDIEDIENKIEQLLNRQRHRAPLIRDSRFEIRDSWCVRSIPMTTGHMILSACLILS